MSVGSSLDSCNWWYIYVVYIVAIKEVDESKVCPLKHSVLISYSTSGAQLIRLTGLRDKPRNLRNHMAIRVDSPKPLVLNKQHRYVKFIATIQHLYDCLPWYLR
jgi:hypothetical protein